MLAPSRQPVSLPGVVRYRPILDRQCRPIGHRLLVLESGADADVAFVRDQLGLQTADLIDTERLLGNAAAEAGAPLAPPPGRYWLSASAALLDALCAVPPQASSIVWLVPMQIAAGAAGYAMCERAMQRGHHVAVRGPAAELASIRGIERFTALHVPAGDERSLDTLYAVKRSGCLLLREPDDDSSPGGAVRAPSSLFDGVEGFAPTRAARAGQAGAAPTYGFVLKALQMLQSDADAAEIEAVLRVDPVLSFRLLRYANAAAYRGSQPVDSVRSAILRVGYRQFSRWLALGLVTSQVDRGSDLAQIGRAVVRGLTMEAIARREPDAAVRESAFMIGLFSLIDGILGVPLAALAQAAALPEPLRRALIAHDGDGYPLLARAIDTEWRPTAPQAAAGGPAPAVVDTLQPIDQALIRALMTAGSLL
ncbi:MAG: HDOD domain-containing protein [Burkholderiaceae bacterium]